ncbi:DUF5641 domain-containing protein [Trichonephila clavata]|uniref:DUF5641 domain-containing protein n=1 Tax=Trichonephila clavata TaxID=2740835 RepID=A0A8X6HQ67_TRICU|nr:DUF5641 domain-containing protein [Trichonephila clavata]
MAFGSCNKIDPGKDGLVRTVKLRTQSCTLIRPIQRVFPLEVSGNSVTSLPLQKVQQIDSSINCADPDTLKATVKPQVTRCGRPVKKPDKLNLLNLTDVFESYPAYQKGRMLRMASPLQPISSE